MTYKHREYKTALDRLYHAMSRRDLGCDYHPNCWNCPLAACILDGYDPDWKESRKDWLPKHWESEEIKHFKELEYADMTDEARANIFRTSVGNIRRLRED